jgi:pilus assembly protein Flp/PilA
MMMMRPFIRRIIYPFVVPHGQGLVEYALIIILVAILVIVMLAIFGDAVVGYMYSNIIANI